MSMQSVVAELEDDHLADGWNEVHTNEPRGICARRNVGKKTTVKDNLDAWPLQRVRDRPV